MKAIAWFLFLGGLSFSILGWYIVAIGMGMGGGLNPSGEALQTILVSLGIIVSLIGLLVLNRSGGKPT